MSYKPTHILENYPECEEEVQANTPMGPRTQLRVRPSQSLLYRASDGMCIGARQATVVSVGEDPKEGVSRTFRDEKYAIAYLRRYADQDECNQTDSVTHAIIEEVDCSDKVEAKQRANSLIKPGLGDIAAITRKQ